MISIHWFRRDLRLSDNAALYHALNSGNKVQCVFIFDTKILDQLENRSDARVHFIHESLKKLDQELRGLGSSLLVLNGDPEQIWPKLAEQFAIASIFANHDYEPYGMARDERIHHWASSKNIAFKTFKDCVIFERNEVLKDDGSPYTVFTPYSRKWKVKLNDFYLKSYPTEKYFSNFSSLNAEPLPSLQDIGFEPSSLTFPAVEPNEQFIKEYDKNRNYPSLDATTRMSIHLRFGTVSPRKLASLAFKLNETYLNELIWRDFYQMILAHFPHVVNDPFKKNYERIAWRNNEEEFTAWCEGRTGYPIVDAGMRELNETGFMHNRVRMITASFLTKHLLIDWRWGEAYFAEKLLDFELASNNGGWQWAAGCGTDAAPYFRIFSPSEQTKKFDPKLQYIRKWVPEFESLNYPRPIVDHAFARDRCLKIYKQGLGAEN